jgi:hypothetical protein
VLCRTATLLTLCVLGCAPQPAEVPPDGWGPSGLSDASQPPRPPRPAAPRPHAIPSSQRERWAGADELDALRSVGGRSASEHASGQLERTVAINAAAGAYERLVPEIVMPAGALIAQRHFRRGSDEIDHWYVMRKSAKAWEFLVLDAQRRVAVAGPMELCARCHGDAPHDNLFGPPASEPALP